MTISQRQAYGEALLDLCRDNGRVVVLDADLCTATQTQLVEKTLPGRFLEMGIGEQNMASAAAGLALAGKIPFINSFAVFATGRPFDQIRQSICLPNLPVKIAGAGSGLSDFLDGATHQSVEDIAIMRALPRMTVFSPADALEAKRAVRAMAALPGPAYIRINRNVLPDATTPETPLEIGKPAVLADGDDVALCATGHMTAMAMAARTMLANRGIRARVVHFATIKPLDADAVRQAIGPARRLVSAEEHSIIGGLGSAILETLSENPLPLRRVGVMDTFGESSESYEKLLAKYGLTPEAIAEAAGK